MSAAAVQIDARIVMQCHHCKLVQFETRSGNCRKCGVNLYGVPQAAVETVIPITIIHERERVPRRKYRVREAGGLVSALPQVFRLCRLIQGMTPTQLGRRVGCTRQYIHKLESSVWLTTPTLSMFCKIAKGLGLPPSRILDFAQEISQ